ncbi:MAG: hypothetical protein IJP84_12085 [Lachnospiraceae bacterium]|nr:hypothetical protein [Lachnospiraceae bacterium]
MSKRFTKFLALLLSTTMVFTLNTTVFGKTGAGEVIEAEEEEGGAPEIVGLIDPGDPIDPDSGEYGVGFGAGRTAYDTDTANGNTEEYDKKIADFNDPEKNFTIEYKAGYYDGYEGKGHAKCLEALNAGYGAGFEAGSSYDNKNAVSDFMETGDYKEPYKVQKLVDIYQEAFKKGVEAAEANMASTAYDRGYNFLDEDDTDLGDLHKEYTTIDKYLASPDFETVKEHYKDYVDGYFAKYTEGLKAAFAYWSKNDGYREGKTAGLYDGQHLRTKVADFDTEEDVDKYVTDVLGGVPDNDLNGYSYKVRWKIYNNKNEADEDGKTTDGNIVGEEFIKYFKEGYDSNYAIAKKDSDRAVPKNAYCDGFARGYLVGTVDGENNNDKGKKKDLEGDENDIPGLAGETYHHYTETDKYSEENPNGNTEEEIKQYIAGFNFGYEAATTTKAYDDGYNKGYDSGEEDAGRDQYFFDAYAGYWEHDYPNSPYNIFKGINSPYAKGYVAGYDDGYNACINLNDVTEENNEAFVARRAKLYSAADMDPWRASTDPAKWDTAQLLINEDNLTQTGNNKYYDNLYFDTRNFKRNNGIPNANNVVFRDRRGGGRFIGDIVATSPFQYYFDLFDKDHLVDKKTVSSNVKLNDYDIYVNDLGENRGSAGQYLYAAFSASSNKAKKPKKGETAPTGTPYVIIRYRLVGAETDENYKVRRYSFNQNGGESVVIDNINNYYKGTDKNGAVVDEPVVPYDSRKIAGVKRDKDGNIENNDKSNRYIIDAEALLITWTEGQPATLIGGVDLNIKAKDNVNATVPATFIDYLGDTAVLQDEMVNPNGYTNDVPVLLKETDKPVNPNPAGDTYDQDIACFSKYYEVTTVNTEDPNGRKGEMGSVTFKGAQSAPKLTAPAKGVTDFSNANAYMSKKGSSPVFTLKAGKLDPSLKAYSKDIKMALKNAELHFEISRMKIASDYVSTIDTIGQDGTPAAPVYNAPGPQTIEFKYEDTVLAAKLNPMYPVVPRRSECGSLEDYQKKVEEYRKALNIYNRYINSEEFKALYRAEFEKAVKAYRAEYNAIVAKYGSKLDYMQKWIEEIWAPGNLNLVFTGDTGNHVAQAFPYTVTKDDRTETQNTPTGNITRIAPVGKNELYRRLVPEDADWNGTITAIEHYEYTVQRLNWPDDVDDPRFNGKLEVGDNIVYNHNLIDGDVIFDTVDCVPNGNRNHKITDFAFTYSYYDIDGVRQDGNVEITIVHDALGLGKYYYGNNNDADGNRVFAIDAYIDFLEDQETDIGIVEDGHDPCVLWPGAVGLDTATGSNDTADIVFSDAVIKAGKKTASGNVAAMTVKATLHSSIFGGWLVEPQVIVPAVGPNIVIPGTPNVERQEKKMKVFIPKADKNGVVTIKKLPKADLKMEQKMAESEPFVVVTGINNYEGTIAIRQRKNGDLGYGYYKNDDFYYLFSEEE